MEDERLSLSSSMRRAVSGRCLLSNTLVTRRYSTRAVLLYQGDQRDGGHCDQGGGPPAVSLLPSLHTHQWQWMPGTTPTASSRCVTPLSSCSQTANAPLTYDHLSRVRQPLQRVHRATSHTAVRAQVTRVARDGGGSAQSVIRWRGVVVACPHTTYTDEVEGTRVVVGGSVVLRPPLAVTPRLINLQTLERDRNGGARPGGSATPPYTIELP